MVTKQRYFPFIIFLCAILLTVTLFVMNNKNRNVPEQTIDKAILYFKEMNESLNNKISGKQLVDIYCMDTLRNVLKLSELILDKKVLVLHFSERNCSSCYEHEIRVLQTFFVDNADSVIILCSYEAYRNFLIFLRLNQVHFPIYRIAHGVMDWELQDYNYPYYFILHQDLTVSDIYIPDNNYPELNAQYFEKIKLFLSD